MKPYLEEEKFRKLSPDEMLKYILYYNKDITAFNSYFFNEASKYYGHDKIKLKNKPIKRRTSRH